MMRVLTLAMALVLTAGAAAQDSTGGKAKPKDCCGSADMLCPKEGKCEGVCREICDRAGETLKAVRTEVVKKMKKVYDVECPCTGGVCTTKSCESCTYVTTKVFQPVMKERVMARFKDLKKTVKHTVTETSATKQTTTKEVTCTFLTGAVCKACVEDISEVSWKKFQEVFAEKK